MTKTHTGFSFSFFLLSLAVALLFAGCFSGFEPAWKAADTRVVFSVSDPLSSLTAGSPSRAVISGSSGWLYIRTIGGPTVNAAGTVVGPYYGPIPASPGTLIAVTDIPAGTYTKLAVLYSDVNFETSGETVNIAGVNTPFREVMSLPDASFETAAFGTNSALEVFLDGRASGFVVDNAVVVENTVNAFNLTLEPLAGNRSVSLTGYMGSWSGAGSSTIMQKRFFKIGSLSIPAGSVLNSLEVSIPYVSGATLGPAALYTSSGKLVSALPATGVMSANVALEFPTVSAQTMSDMYLYMEYLMPTLSFNVTAQVVQGAAGSNVQVAASFSGTYTGDTAFYGIYADENLPPVAVGLIVLDSVGYGVSLPYVPGTANPAVLADGNYFISLMVDSGGVYSSITSGANITVTGIVPHQNDYVTTDKFIPFTISLGSATVAIGLSDMSVTSDVPLFVAATSTGGTGEIPAEAISLDEALGFVAGTPSGYEYRLYLLENVVATNPAVIQNNVAIMSADSSPKTISYSTTSYFIKTDGYSCALLNIVLDGQGVSRGTALLSVMNSGTLALMAGTEIRNTVNSVDGEGGGVFVMNAGVCVLDDALITGCISDYGGGVYLAGTLGQPAVLQIFEGQITGNQANYNGGGVYVGIYSTVQVDVTVASTAVTGNTLDEHFEEDATSLWDDTSPL